MEIWLTIEGMGIFEHFLFANVSKKDDFIQNIVIIMRIEDDLTRTLLFFTLTVIGIGILAWVICWHWNVLSVLQLVYHCHWYWFWP